MEEFLRSGGPRVASKKRSGVIKQKKSLQIWKVFKIQFRSRLPKQTSNMKKQTSNFHLDVRRPGGLYIQLVYITHKITIDKMGGW